MTRRAIGFIVALIVLIATFTIMFSLMNHAIEKTTLLNILLYSSGIGLIFFFGSYLAVVLFVIIAKRK